MGYIAEIGSGLLGQTWVERQILVINISNLAESATEIACEPGEYLTTRKLFEEGLLQTIFHESRHLIYECNELVNTGEGTPYPEDGGLEDEVEDYGNLMASRCLYDFQASVLNGKVLAEELEKMVRECALDSLERE